MCLTAHKNYNIVIINAMNLMKHAQFSKIFSRYTIIFLNFDDEELFFVRGLSFDLKWCKVSSIPAELMETYRASKNRGRSITKCNTDKTAQYSCDMKVKTCGLLLACTHYTKRQRVLWCRVVLPGSTFLS